MSNVEMKFSDQAIGALMMALQKCLSEQSDITGILRNLNLRLSTDGLMIMNPPVVKLNLNLDLSAEEEADASL